MVSTRWNPNVREARLCILASAGAAGKLDAVIAGAEKRYPADTLLRERNFPAARALQEIRRSEPSRALEILQPRARFGAYPPLYYTRGLALLGVGRAQEAMGEFQKVLDLRYFWPTSAYITLAHLGLARAAAVASNTAEARKHYQDFFTIVKDADPDIPILKEAKTEYAKLQ